MERYRAGVYAMEQRSDFEKLIRQYDRPASLFYLDPPYHATEGYYQNIGEDGFTETDHIRLRVSFFFPTTMTSSFEVCMTGQVSI